MNTKFDRDSISRARLFIEMARECDMDHRDQHEAFLDAAIVFARSALLRLQSANKRKPGWSAWWSALAADPSFTFLRHYRNFELHERPQLVSAGGDRSLALDHCCFGDHTVPAVDTLARHMDRIEEIVRDAEPRFR
jgi:hypothetical protein